MTDIFYKTCFIILILIVLIFGALIYRKIGLYEVNYIAVPHPSKHSKILSESKNVKEIIHIPEKNLKVFQYPVSKTAKIIVEPEPE